MKRFFSILMTMMVIQSANALIVSVQGEGEVSEEGLELLITEGEEDVLSGLYTMELRGNLLTSATEITVRITRSASGLTDEFCCGSNCTAGNGATEETKVFAVSGVANWYAHYVPSAGSDETIRYVFDDGEETRSVSVRYVHSAEGIGEIKGEWTKGKWTKVMREGQVVIRCQNKEYNITGKQL